MSPFDFSVIVPKMRRAIEDYMREQSKSGIILSLKEAVVEWMNKYYENWFHAHVGIPLLDIQQSSNIVSAGSIDEKRRHKRIPVEISAYYRVLWIPNEPISDTIENSDSGEIKNISSGGLYIVTGRPYPISTLLEIQFELPGIEGIIAAFAMVVWRQERSFGRYGHGLHFSHIETQSSNYLDEAIMEKLLDAPVICVPKE